MSLNYYTVDALPVSSEQIAICFSGDKKLAWLELTNFDYLITKSYSHKIVTVLIGAMPVITRTRKAPPALTRFGPPVQVDEVTWHPIDMWKAVASNPQRVPIEADLEPEQILKFQSAIIESWKGFSHSRAAEYTKGTTFGKSFTSPSFVAKALKTGYEAAGVARSSYPGIKLSNWSVDDLLAYANRNPHPPCISGFTRYYPHPYHMTNEVAGKQDPGTIPLLESKKSCARTGYAYDDHFKKQENEGLTSGIKRVTAYGFRGDNRPPKELAPGITLINGKMQSSAGGLWANATRKDHVEATAEKSKSKDPFKRGTALQLEGERLHLGEHIKDQYYKGYVSVSRSTLVAKSFSNSGYVYALFAQGAFDVPKNGDHPFAIYDEQELAMPGGFDWEDVVGFRQTRNKMFTGPVYLRREFFHDENPAILTELYLLLSGKTPGSSTAPEATEPIFKPFLE